VDLAVSLKSSTSSLFVRIRTRVETPSSRMSQDKERTKATELAHWMFSMSKTDGSTLETLRRRMYTDSQTSSLSSSAGEEGCCQMIRWPFHHTDLRTRSQSQTTSRSTVQISPKTYSMDASRTFTTVILASIHKTGLRNPRIPSPWTAIYETLV